MAIFGQKRPKLSRKDILAAKPVRNPRAETESLTSGNLEVSVPYEKPKGLTWFYRGTRQFKRRFEMDRLGHKVWDMCDGQRTVREMIEQFAKSEGINVREAEVSMLAYLETLGRRGIIFMAIGPGDQPPQAESP